MHPALSLIAFTTLSGAGFGLMVWLGLGLGPQGVAGLVGAGLALALAGVGLLASTLHLARPDRAWRALSQWRSSWLSREGVLAIATLALFALFALLQVAGSDVSALGRVAAVLAAVTVYATAMIYAQLRTVPAWSQPLTPPLFLGHAGAAGACLLAALTGAEALATGLALALVALAWGIQVTWWARAAGAEPDAEALIGAATGLGRLGRVRAFEAPHTGGNYLLHEMAFRVARNRALALRRVALGAGAGGAALLLLLALALPGPATGGILAGLAALASLTGTASARWLFFAEARHVQASYYGDRAEGPGQDEAGVS